MSAPRTLRVAFLGGTRFIGHAAASRAVERGAPPPEDLSWLGLMPNHLVVDA